MNKKLISIWMLIFCTSIGASVQVAAMDSQEEEEVKEIDPTDIENDYHFRIQFAVEEGKKIKEVENMKKDIKDLRKKGIYVLEDNKEKKYPIMLILLSDYRKFAVSYNFISHDKKQFLEGVNKVLESKDTPYEFKNKREKKSENFTLRASNSDEIEDLKILFILEKKKGRDSGLQESEEDEIMDDDEESDDEENVSNESNDEKDEDKIVDTKSRGKKKGDKSVLQESDDENNNTLTKGLTKGEKIAAGIGISLVVIIPISCFVWKRSKKEKSKVRKRRKRVNS